MTPSVAASLIREAVRGWTSAETAQFCLEIKDLYRDVREHEHELELDERYAKGYAKGYAHGFDAALEDSTDN